MAETTPTTVTVDGQQLSFPIEVRDASIASFTVLGSARGARDRLRPLGLHPVTPVPGRALLSVSVIDYRDNDLGSYVELAVAVVVKRPGRGQLGTAVDFARGRVHTHITHLPVNQRFTWLAGRQLWGFPKTVDELDFDVVGETLSAVWSRDGELIARVTAPAVGDRQLPQIPMQTYTAIDGRPHVTEFSLGGQGGRFGSGRKVSVELGSHPVADELRALGLPGRALSSVWIERASGSFGPARPLGN